MGDARRARRDGRPPGLDGDIEGSETIFSIGSTAKEERAARKSRHEKRRRVRPPRLRILRTTDRWIAALKPSGMASVRESADPEGVTAIDAMERLWRKREPDEEPPRLVHRLDKETSGLVLFARGAESAARISEAFRERKIGKEYRALVIGAPPEDAGDIELRLLGERRRGGALRVSRNRGKRAATGWEVVERFRGWSWLRVIPITGRTHQIRVTLAHLGCPVVADPLYGGGDGLRLSALKPGWRQPGRQRQERPLLGRLALHAFRLGFDDVDGTPVELEAPLPKDLRVALDRLREYVAVDPPTDAPSSET